MGGEDGGERDGRGEAEAGDDDAEDELAEEGEEDEARFVPSGVTGHGGQFMCGIIEIESC